MFCLKIDVPGPSLTWFHLMGGKNSPSLRVFRNGTPTGTRTDWKVGPGIQLSSWDVKSEISNPQVVAGFLPSFLPSTSWQETASHKLMVFTVSFYFFQHYSNVNGRISPLCEARNRFYYGG